MRNMEQEIYSILRKYRLPLKKREELIEDLITLFISDNVGECSNVKGYDIAHCVGYSVSRTILETDYETS